MKRKGDFLLQNVGGQDFLVPLGSRVVDMNGMIVLNPTARFVWELLADECSLTELAEAMANRFTVDTERASGDIQIFLDEIDKWGLLDK